MTPSTSSTLLSLLVLLTAMRGAAAAEQLSFEQHIRPVLKVYCLDCHGAGEKLRGGLDLRLRRFVLRGGENGPAVVARDARKSLLTQRLHSGQMPPGDKKVPAESVALIERWINAGAPTLRDEPTTLPPGVDITPEERAFWFYQPLRRVEPGKFALGDRVRTPLDAFVLTRLRARGLSFNPDADRLTLVRRASLNLTGLPPSQQQIDSFLGDRSEQAYETMIEGLLASPAYGERWGRHWLDVVGHADSEGDGSTDTLRPHAWRYRDYVIRSFNADKPLDRFVIEQLAGDELVPRPWTNLRLDQIELLAATGFLRTAPDPTVSGGGVAAAQQVVADSLKIVGSSLLGLTVGCAQCHDHKYDPIPHSDYFRLRAIFEPAYDPARWRTGGMRRVSLSTDADRARAAAIEAEAAKLQADHNEKQGRHVRAAFDRELARFPADERDRLRAAFDTPDAQRTPDQKKLVASNPKLNISPGLLYQYDQRAADELKKLQDGIAAKRAQKPIEDFVAVMDEVPGQIPLTRIFHRGDYREPRGEVQPGDLTIAAPEGKRLEIPFRDPKATTSGRRLAFARHLTSGSHPLLGRVLANRVWLHHFGQGIVDTPGDFGVLGQRPTHPELLDWLALELPRQGWSMKALHRLILTSTVYRQSARRERAKDAVDAGNALLGRFAVRRLDAEALRDRILFTTGQLDRTPFGPAVPLIEDFVGQVYVPEDRQRRSVYLQMRRTRPLAFLAAFDAPVGELNCDRRISSTTAPQSLMLMNSDFILKQAGQLARRARAEVASQGVRAQIERAWQLAYQRAAAPEELGLAGRFVERQSKQLQSLGRPEPELAALTNLCQQLLASNEFLYVD